MSDLTYNRTTHRITLTGSDGQQIGQWTAYNNAQSTSNGAFDAGTYTFSHRTEHAGSNAESGWGSNGVTVFNVVGRTGMGVHSGRATTADQAGRTGPQHATNGCIRSTDAATEQIETTHATDPIESLTVE